MKKILLLFLFFIVAAATVMAQDPVSNMKVIKHSFVDQNGNTPMEEVAHNEKHVLRDGNTYTVKFLVKNSSGEPYKGKIQLALWDSSIEKSYVINTYELSFEPQEEKELEFQFGYDDVREFEKPYFHTLSLFCTDERWVRDYNEDGFIGVRETYPEGRGSFTVFVGDESVQEYLRRLEGIEYKLKMKNREKEELERIKETSKAGLDGHFGDKYLNGDADYSFPHYHQTDSVVGANNVYFPMPWRSDVMNNNGAVGDRTTISRDGCFLTSFTQAIQALGRGANPRYTNLYVQKEDANGYGRSALLDDPVLHNYIAGNNSHEIIKLHTELYGKSFGINSPKDLKDHLIRNLNNTTHSDFGVALFIVKRAKEDNEGNEKTIYKHRVICKGFNFKEDDEYTWSDFYINDSSFNNNTVSELITQSLFTPQGDSEYQVLSARFLYPVNGYRFITKEFDFYDYKPVGLTGITIAPRRTPEGVFLPKYENAPEYDTIIPEFKDNLSFEYMGGSDLFTETGLSHLVAKTITRTETSEADQNYCYGRWYFKISEAQDYTLEAVMPPEYSHSCGELRYSLYRRDFETNPQKFIIKECHQSSRHSIFFLFLQHNQNKYV